MNQAPQAPSPSAQPSQKSLTVEGRSTEFVPVTGGQETTSAEALLLSAYIIMWALVFGFVWLSVRRQRGIAARLDDVERALRRADSDGSRSPTSSS